MVEQAVMSSVMAETEDVEWLKQAHDEGLASGFVEMDLDEVRARLRTGRPLLD